MNHIKSTPGNGLLDRFFWDFSYKNRKLLLPILIVGIVILGFLLTQKFIIQEITIKKLSEFEPIYVFAARHDLNTGDIIHKEDLEPLVFSKKEFTQIKYHDTANNLDKPALYIYQLDSKAKTLSNSTLIGRVVKAPILSKNPIREESLAPQGSLPGLHNLLSESQSLFDFEVIQTGFNIYLKPGDKVDLFESINGRTNIIAKDVEIILVDSLGQGKAPYAVASDPAKKRNLTLIVPSTSLAAIAKARKSQNLYLTLSKNPITMKDETITKVKKVRLKNESGKAFQPLTIIQGKKRELITQ